MMPVFAEPAVLMKLRVVREDFPCEQRANSCEVTVGCMAPAACPERVDAVYAVPTRETALFSWWLKRFAASGFCVIRNVCFS